MLGNGKFNQAYSVDAGACLLKLYQLKHNDNVIH